MRSAPPSFEIIFESLLKDGCDLAFPCDEHGRVEIDALDECARIQYFFARVMVGRRYEMWRVACCASSEPG